MRMVSGGGISKKIVKDCQPCSNILGKGRRPNDIRHCHRHKCIFGCGNGRCEREKMPKCLEAG